MTARPHRSPASWLVVGGLLVLLASCASEQDELQVWMDQQKREVKPNVTPLSEPKQFRPQSYLAYDGVEPFSQQKLTVGLRGRDSRQPSTLFTAELSRRKEPLEAFPLDSMTMVGSVRRKGVPFALLRVDRLLYQVKQGDYLGQNFGKITKITEDEITLREIVQDATGEWIERPGSLQLQENAK